MTYATGSATTTANLLDAMSAFAQANAGMTESVRRSESILDRNGVSQTYTVICLTKSTSNWWFAYTSDEALGFLADSDGGSAWLATGGVQSALASRLWPCAAPFTSYHFFTEGSVVHMAAEMSSGAWTHLNFGDITKYGTWTGGSFIGVTNAETNMTFFGDLGGFNALFGEASSSPFGSGQTVLTSQIRIAKGSRNYGTFDGEGVIHADDTVTSPVMALAMTAGVSDTLTRDTPSIFNGRTAGPRMEVFVSDDATIFSGGSGLWLPIGYIPNIRLINIALLNPKDIINTDWMAFPLQSKTGLAGSFAQTLNFGWAVKK